MFNVVVAFVCPSARWTVTTSQPASLAELDALTTRADIEINQQTAPQRATPTRQATPLTAGTSTDDDELPAPGG